MKKIAAAIILGTLSLTANAAGDIQAGKAKSMMCAACHGPKGISTVGLYPNIAGQKEQYLVKAMKDFKSGKRKDPVMAPMVMGLSDDDIKNISAYYASLK